MFYFEISKCLHRHVLEQQQVLTIEIQYKVFIIYYYYYYYYYYCYYYIITTIIIVIIIYLFVLFYFILFFLSFYQPGNSVAAHIKTVNEIKTRRKSLTQILDIGERLGRERFH